MLVFIFVEQVVLWFDLASAGSHIARTVAYEALAVNSKDTCQQTTDTLKAFEDIVSPSSSENPLQRK